MEMANILILGGGFGGVVAAEWLAKELGHEHHTIYLHKGLWVDEPTIIGQGRFWSWAKRIQEKCGLATHS